MAGQLSLARRLFVSSTLWTAAILVVTGIALTSIYRGAVERSFDRRLSVYIKTIVADLASPEDGTANYPQQLGEPMFELPLSGWYWQVTRLDGATDGSRSSRSLWDGGLPHLADRGVPAKLGGAREGYVDGPEEQHLRLVERIIDLGDDGRYLIAVAGDASEISEEIRNFDFALILTFIALGLGLLLVTMFQVRFGLKPLRKASSALAAIRSGQAERLEGDFPDEISPLVHEANALIDANREIVERERTHLGNLAHALKTPLSVMLNEAEGREDPLADKVREQVLVMQDQVRRNLERARVAARAITTVIVTPVEPVLQSLVRTMRKIHRDRAIDLVILNELRFRGDKHDLEEMVGNLIDNACKWAVTRISIEAVEEPLDPADGRQFLRIMVDDDGPGLTPQQREEVLGQRGRRLDETVPGSGLGLSIVQELATVYGGRLELSAAPTGGLRAELRLPSAGWTHFSPENA